MINLVRNQQLLRNISYAKILAMILTLEPSDSFESLKISFFNQLLDDQASFGVKEILCLQNSHQLLDYKAYFSQILPCTERLKLSPNRLDILYIITQLNRQHIHGNLLNECINALIEYPNKFLLKGILNDLAQKQTPVTATSLMYMIHQEHHPMLIAGVSQKSAVLGFNLNIFMNYLRNNHITFEDNFSNIQDYDHEQLYSLTSSVFKQISLESPHSSGLMGWLSMCFEKQLVNIHNITEIMSCAFPEQYLLALQNLIATNTYLNSPQQIFKTFLSSAQPQMLVEIIYLCQHNALLLSPQRLEIFNKHLNLMDIHQFMGQIFRKKIFHKPQNFIEFLAKFLNLKFSDELMPHIQLILETIPAQEFEFFMMKFGESSKRFLILEVLQKVKEFKQPINMVNTLFHCQSENLENLLQFINTYQQLNVKIIERFAQSSFDYQYTLKELNLLIDSEYVDINVIWDRMSGTKLRKNKSYSSNRYY